MRDNTKKNLHRGNDNRIPLTMVLSTKKPKCLQRIAQKWYNRGPVALGDTLYEFSAVWEDVLG